MNRDALSPAEMARSGTMSEAIRRQNMGMSHGGTVIDGYDYGKKKKKKKSKNTKRMNRLEELGRVDAEKGKSRKGKKNLKAEKKRIIRELKKRKA
tara:strand:+ start:223 stop:507 length:285 start_codon:yes stop_codon:yes gene_type:complete